MDPQMVGSNTPLTAIRVFFFASAMHVDVLHA